jgi:hypothetical protein
LIGKEKARRHRQLRKNGRVPFADRVPNKTNPRGRGNRNDEGNTAKELDASKEARHWTRFQILTHSPSAARLATAGPAFPVAASSVSQYGNASHAQAACNIVATRLQP